MRTTNLIALSRRPSGVVTDGRDASPTGPKFLCETPTHAMDALGRKYFDHAVPPWIDPDARDFFLTICCQRRGENPLCTPTVGQALLATARFYHEQQKWLPSVFLLMPDHVHMIVSFGRGQTMEKTIRAWKRYTAINHGIEWQRDFFDHRLRSPFDFYGKEHYILQNPVRAGLIQNAPEWPFVLRTDL